MSEPTVLSSETQRLQELLLTYLRDTVNFTVAQAPSVFQEMLRWQYMSALLCLVFFVVAVLTLVYTATRFQAKCADPKAYALNEETPWRIAGSAAGLASLGGFSALCVEGSCALQAYIAPKLFLIGEIKKLLY